MVLILIISQITLHIWIGIIISQLVILMILILLEWQKRKFKKYKVNDFQIKVKYNVVNCFIMELERKNHD